MAQRRRMRFLGVGTVVSALGLAGTGCGKGLTAGASATFAMGKTTATSFASLLAEGIAPHLLTTPGSIVGVMTTPTYYTFQASDSFKVKLIAAYLTEDVNATTQNNVGSTQMIYLNAGCNEDISNCEADGISTFFEFNQSESALNAQLNAQARTIAAGEYKYVRLELCKNTPSAANMKFTVQGLSEVQIISNRCTMNSGNDGASNTLVPMDPPITVSEGQSVQIRLDYNINRFINIQTGSGGSNCTVADGSGNFYCNYGYFFRPSVTVL